MRSRRFVAVGWATAVVLLAGCALVAPIRTPTEGEVAGLPLIEQPVAAPAGAPLAILLSGDGGWSGHMQVLAEQLGERGISTVGWNSLRYFWQNRPPEEGARDLARIIDHYRRAWRSGPIVLVGYSWGADVLPAMANRLPDSLVASLSGVAVIGFSGHENFHFHIASWFGHQVGRSYPAGPEIRQLALSGIPILCVNGIQEKERGCESVSARALRTVFLPTGHHFEGSMDEIAELIAALAHPRKPLAGGGSAREVAIEGSASGD